MNPSGSFLWLVALVVLECSLMVCFNYFLVQSGNWVSLRRLKPTPSGVIRVPQIVSFVLWSSLVGLEMARWPRLPGLLVVCGLIVQCALVGGQMALWFFWHRPALRAFLLSRGIQP